MIRPTILEILLHDLNQGLKGWRLGRERGRGGGGGGGGLSEHQRPSPRLGLRLGRDAFDELEGLQKAVQHLSDASCRFGALGPV